MWITFLKSFLKADICCLRAIAVFLGWVLIACGKVLLFLGQFEGLKLSTRD